MGIEHVLRSETTSAPTLSLCAAAKNCRFLRCVLRTSVGMTKVWVVRLPPKKQVLRYAQDDSTEMSGFSSDLGSVLRN
jgi:hypothetical protein